MNGSTPSSAAGIDRKPRPGQARLAVRWVLSPHPISLPWGEGEPFDPRRTVLTRRLSTARCALFPLPAGEGQGEGKRRGKHPLFRISPGTVELGKSSGEAGGFPE